MNTIRLYWCKGCVKTDVLSGNHKGGTPEKKALTEWQTEIVELNESL